MSNIRRAKVCQNNVDTTLRKLLAYYLRVLWTCRPSKLSTNEKTLSKVSYRVTTTTILNSTVKQQSNIIYN